MKDRNEKREALIKEEKARLIKEETARLLRTECFPFSAKNMAIALSDFAGKQKLDNLNLAIKLQELADSIGNRDKEKLPLFSRSMAIRMTYENPIEYEKYNGEALRNATVDLIKDLMEAFWDSDGKLRTRNAKNAAEKRHSKPGGSRDKQEQIRAIWANGKYTSRDVCAEQECAALGMSFSTARKALRNR